MFHMSSIFLLIVSLDCWYGFPFRATQLFRSFIDPSWYSRQNRLSSHGSSIDSVDQCLGVFREACSSIVVPDNATLSSFNLVQSMSRYTPALDRTTDLKDFRRVQGCISEVYLSAKIGVNGMVELHGASDSLLARAILGLLQYSLKHVPATSLHFITTEKLVDLSGGLFAVLPPGRLNGLGNMLQIIKQQISENSPSSKVISINDDIEYINDGDRSVAGYAKDDITRLLGRFSKDDRKNDYKVHGSESEVAMLLSGGVDSSVALKLLLEQGYKVRAFYLKIWLEDELAHLNECPWEEDLAYAAKVCDQLHVPLETVSLQQEYWKEVVDYTLHEAKLGRTPNPDIMCNSRIKFGMFYDYIGKHFKYVATGHYARIERSGEDHQEDVYLKQSPDPVKDQTYFLCNLRQDQLNKALFPIGHLQKEQVRELASQFNLPTKSRKDSQGICFLGKLKFDDFIEHYLGVDPGDVKVFEDTGVLKAGEVVGKHRGLWFHTIGQRKGLGPLFTRHGVVNEGPWFVASKNLTSNELYITNNVDVIRDSSRCVFQVENLNWINGMPEGLRKGGEMRFLVKVRHSPEICPCTVVSDGDEVAGNNFDNSRLTVKLSKVEKGIAPGQFAAFYSDGVCVGAGVIAI